MPSVDTLQQLSTDKDLYMNKDTKALIIAVIAVILEAFYVLLS